MFLADEVVFFADEAVFRADGVVLRADVFRADGVVLRADGAVFRVRDFGVFFLSNNVVDKYCIRSCLESKQLFPGMKLDPV